MPDRALGLGLRLLVGLIGAVAVAAGAGVATAQIRIASRSGPHWPAIAVVAFCVIVVLGGLLLVRGAVTGHITVRRPGRPGPLI